MIGDRQLGASGETTVVLSHEQRRRHMLVVGASDRGKSRFLQHIIRQDLLDHKKPGLMVLDPHGTLYHDLVAWCASRGLDGRRKFHLVDPHNEDWSVGFNPFSAEDADPDALATGIANSFCKVWGHDLSDKPGVSEALDIVFYTLAANNLTLLETTEMTELHQQEFRTRMAETIEDPDWRKRMEHFISLAAERQSQQLFVQQMSAVGRRVGKFTGSPRIRRMFAQTEDTLDIRQCMKDGDVVFVNLKPHTKRFPLENTRLLGTILLNAVYSEGFDRTEEEGMKKPFHLYIDECHRFLTDEIRDLLFEMRKFGIHLHLGLQDLGQLHDAGEGIYSGVMQGAQTKIVFGGLGTHAKEMAEQIYMQEVSIEKGVEATKGMKVVGYESVQLEAGSTSITIGDNDLYSSSDGSSWHETYVPILEEGYTQVHSPESLFFEYGKHLDGLPKQEAIVKSRDGRPIRFRVADVHDASNKQGSKLPGEFTQRVLQADSSAKRTEDVQKIIDARAAANMLVEHDEDIADSY